MKNDSTRGRRARHAAAMLALLLALASPFTPVAAATISGATIAADAITLAFDGAVASARAFLLTAPDRLVVDLTGAAHDPIVAGAGLVTGMRVGTPSGGRTRVVFDRPAPSRLGGTTLAPDGRTLRIAVAAGPARVGAPVPAAAMALRGEVAMTLPPPRPYRLRLPPVRGRADRPLVVIDAGHGGHDPGSLSLDGRRQEKDAALAIARAMRDELLASGRVRVAMTRDDDVFLPLQDRREIARRLDADLFISVHADSAPGSAARGATVYTLSEVASDRVAAQLAAKENRADVLHGVDLGEQTSDVSSILVDLTQRETMNSSSRFADLLQHELADQGVEFKSIYHRFAGLAVLKAPDVPAVLLETGYMSSAEDLGLLFSSAYQHELAVGVTRAIETHFARRVARDEDVAARD